MRGRPVHSTGTPGYDLRLTSRRTDHTLIITVSGDVDLDTVEPLQYALSNAHTGPDQARTIVLDLSAVTFAGTSLINVLLRARTLLGPERLRIADPSPCVARLMRLTELDRHFTIDTAIAFASTAATAT
ncbi:STAS domain-containing protein [Streptomyces sp. H10-C2]|uniref:STAS domain-containing protein n=1 Tax=unclassified Streptomyces TaxID=2593676 RepID=UPI0024BAA363|nr:MULTISPECIES: STAS domain-containing protein [unclassified Streptomyces]MDJ0347348.1 STAS domain-containing protein [Streptomyces sp. PH10-H1]MDJ0375557.1 STAS domain-containing protein [Streptomyces sp. H10-C2]